MAKENRNLERRGFEAILRPIQDAIAQDWKLKLKNFLYQYFLYLQKLATVNFSDADLLVQNKYDLIYNWVGHFCLSLRKDDESIEQEEPAQKKMICKKKKDVDFDMLEKLDYRSTANMQRAPMEVNHADIPTVKLDTNRTPMYKPNISCPIFQLKDGKQICVGYKDDFQMCGSLLNSGRLYQDIFQRNIFMDDENETVEEEEEDSESFLK